MGKLQGVCEKTVEELVEKLGLRLEHRDTRWGGALNVYRGARLIYEAQAGDFIRILFYLHGYSGGFKHGQEKARD